MTQPPRFIQLTDVAQRTEIYINADEIVACFYHEHNTEVDLRNGQKIGVEETPSAIMKMLNAQVVTL
jgi:hypothetical protein